MKWAELVSAGVKLVENAKSRGSGTVNGRQW